MESSKNSIYDIVIRLLFLLFIIGWCLLIIYPFASIILWSVILAIAIYPLHKSLAAKIGGKPKLASVIVIFSILGIILVPALFMTSSLIGEVKELKISFDDGTLSIPPPSEKVKDWPLVGENFYNIWQSSTDGLKQTIGKYKDQLKNVASNIAKGVLSTASGVTQILIALFIAGILLVLDGAADGIRKLFRKLAGNMGDEFADVTMKTVNNVVKGVLGVALILALLHGILFTLAGVPYAGLWTLLIFVLSVLQIPAVIVTIPIIIYMFAIKEPVPAIVWTVLLMLAGLSDNFLKPILLGKGAPVPMLVIFIGVIGGFILSGFIGLFTGAIVMSVSYRLFTEWINTSAPNE